MVLYDGTDCVMHCILLRKSGMTISMKIEGQGTNPITKYLLAICAGSNCLTSYKGLFNIFSYVCQNFIEDSINVNVIWRVEIRNMNYIIIIIIILVQTKD